MSVAEVIATVYIGGPGGFVCPFVAIRVDRDVVTLTPPLIVRWLVRTRRVTAAETESVTLSSSAVTVRKKNGMIYRIVGANAPQTMAAFRDGGFPLRSPS